MSSFVTGRALVWLDWREHRFREFVRRFRSWWS